MLTDDQLASLDEAWTPARAAGVIGTAPVEALVEHTVWFARAVCSSFSASFDEFDGRIVDVGTGAGLPGVILAALLPHAELRLVDASERRLDHARRASRALGVGDRVEIAHGRGDELAHDAAWRGTHDVAVARLLGDPAETIEQLAALGSAGRSDHGRCRRVGDGSVGCAAGHRTAHLVGFLVRVPVGLFASVNVLAPIPSSFPRQERKRRQSPLF
jgi:hypothetical protein